MKPTLTLILVALQVIVTVHAAEHVVNNSGFTFSPDEITIQAGDVINFELGSSHNAVEVDKSTWDANGNTSNGGFSLDLGGGSVAFETPGTYYYVCAPHASMGMKGKVIVESATAAKETLFNSSFEINVFPNPAAEVLNIAFYSDLEEKIEVTVNDITGKQILFEQYVTGLSGYTEFRVDVNHLPGGLYYLKFEKHSDAKVIAFYKQ